MAELRDMGSEERIDERILTGDLSMVCKRPSPQRTRVSIASEAAPAQGAIASRALRQQRASSISIQQTLKTLRRWLPAVLFLGLLVPHAAAALPAEVLRTANIWAFLATMAVRCDTHLEWRGYAGVPEDVCVDFLAQYKQASDAWATTTAQFSKVATAAETAQSPAAALEWDTFLQGFQASVNHVSNILGRLEALRQAEAEQPTKAPRRRKK